MSINNSTPDSNSPDHNAPSSFESEVHFTYNLRNHTYNAHIANPSTGPTADKDLENSFFGGGEVRGRGAHHQALFKLHTSGSAALNAATAASEATGGKVKSSLVWDSRMGLPKSAACPSFEEGSPWLEEPSRLLHKPPPLSVFRDEIPEYEMPESLYHRRPLSEFEGASKESAYNRSSAEVGTPKEPGGFERLQRKPSTLSYGNSSDGASSSRGVQHPGLDTTDGDCGPEEEGREMVNKDDSSPDTREGSSNDGYELD